MSEEVKVKALSKKQAQRCEEAREPVCKCRCGGAYHGAKRGGENTPEGFFYELPEDDPHYIPSPAKKRAMRNARAREKTRLKQEKIAAAYAKLYSKQNEESPDDEYVEDKGFEDPYQRRGYDRF